MGMFDRLTTMFNPDSVFKKEDGSLIPLNDARQIILRQATEADMDDTDGGEFVRNKLKRLGYNMKEIRNQTRPAASSTEKD
mgnify:FL=1|jgi:hypothetical protein|tara:strand:+ start:1657 stop:1899 length:243 start_codon:yes stop_codon:yes gene_type:complete